MSGCFLAKFCQCSVTVTMCRNNVSVICYMLVTGYVLLGLGEIACNKCPVLLLLLLFLHGIGSHA